MSGWRTFAWQDGRLTFLDQTLLPGETRYITTQDYRVVADAIRRLKVRGAPAIGIAAAYGVVLGAKELAGAAQFGEKVRQVISELAETRPTAVNLFWALKRQQAVLERNESQAEAAMIITALENEACQIAAEDEQVCRAIGENGATLLADGITVLTHCNAGALATAAYGTALSAIRMAHRQGKRISVFADETRPLLQGARLTVWELMQEGIPVTLITDNMAAAVMHLGKVQAVIVGADRITANGDVANKIGTYGLAVLAKEHGIPFYVAAPLSTIDLELASGADIPIEERAAAEVTSFGGIPVAPEGVAVFNPAFDVTPAKYVTAIITEKGIATGDWKRTFRSWITPNE
ncbi:methylthioribose-1-phosphate isomerase [Hydrogenispora ethanolica]|uniref:Methylthioribose-1-phosphate isomerase n=1 Tax=Hydrogenispora ethanolica TaxID=1082276 RepID=A0A4R1RFE0_HYDET|nr:S-methyl-5-thioribose-1-phosphate isomerase [Hydrogenispora ethanolica]TCL64292.1 methylthioribose-1-phosphate isomerase [Hydrogenispora ethanolica]